MKKTVIFVVLTIIMITSHQSAFSDSQSIQAKTLRKFDVPMPAELTRMSPNYFNNTIGSSQASQFLFNVIAILDKNGHIVDYTIKLDPKFASLYKQVGFTGKSTNIAFIYPVFTQAAYSNGGFYDYYKKQCDLHCLTITIPTTISSSFSSSRSATFVLSLLNYSQINDVDIDKNPDILKQYSTIIVLHSEYVTKKEFYAITNHPHVIYLYPNALYAEVKTDYSKNTITLVKGHGYPDPLISNGFGWKFDNSKYEHDTKCDNWKFEKIPQGKMLNCYPSSLILKDKLFLQSLKKSSSKN